LRAALRVGRYGSLTETGYRHVRSLAISVVRW